MLSFLKEQGTEDTSEQKTSGSSGASGEEKQKQEYLTVASKSKSVRKGTMLLAVLFGTGLLCLWFMIQKSTPETATAASADSEQTHLETAIARLTGVSSEMLNRMDEIVRKFYEFSDVRQVKVTELVKNPFEYEMFLANLKDESGAEDKNLINAEMLRQQVKKLQLLSIMQTEQGNCCMINDKILYEGDSISNLKIRQIGNNYVKLQWGRQGGKEGLGTQIILKLSK